MDYRRRYIANKNDVQVRCACDSWARQVNTATVRYQRHTHAPGCPNRAVDDELWDVMARLLCGMDCWASDEGGAIHPEAWQAYSDARALVGVPVSETAT